MIDDAPIERGKSAHWLSLIEKAEKVFSDWQDASDNIDKAYADLSTLRTGYRDRQFQLFWSNIQVMGPAIYARPPLPVVTPKFKDRRPLYRTSSEFLERSCVVSFDLADIDQHMLALRDDLAIVGRGAAWVRYESDEDGERVCYEHVDRKDFLHDPARKWCDVDWVARRAWLTRDEMDERFGDAAFHVTYETRRDDDVATVEKCGVWEIWCKSENKVVWVTSGSEETLDEADPHLTLEGFFPCPRPAYATVQRRSLIPVPDMLIYKDQLEEVNDLTKRIHVLADAIKVRGFYSGGGDVGEAIERAMKMVDDEQILIPVPNMQSLVQGGGDPIMWLPLDMVAQTITGLIELRRQVIEDVYQIIGLSDIMRGQTQADETLGAQRIKQQNGSSRVRDKQNELVRVARDLVRIGAEIMAEEFSEETLIEMAQMDLPTDAEVKKQIKEIEAGARKELAALGEQAQSMADQARQTGQQIDPEQAQQQFEQQQQAIIAKWEGQLQQAQDAVTIEAVMGFLGDEKLRPFVLDIETDSTIYPDEVAEKQSRQEFMAAFAGTMAQLQPLMAMGPEAIAVAGGVMKFALSPYRVGRELESLIDDFTDRGPEIAKQLQSQQGESDEMAQANMALAQAEMKKAEAAVAKVQADTAGKQQEMQLKAAEAEAKAREGQQKFMLEVEQTKGSISETQARIEKIFAEIQKMGFDAQSEERTQDREDAKAAASIDDQQFQHAMTVADKQRQVVEDERSNARADRGEDRADRQMEQGE
jgi:hypothetical protein